MKKLLLVTSLVALLASAALAQQGPGPGPAPSTGGSGGCPVATPCSTAQSVTAAGALSASAYNWTGAPVTGGSGTTTFPLLYLNSGAAPTTFSTGGTLLGFNAPSGFAGNFFDCHVNGGASVCSMNQLGTLLLGGNVSSLNVISSITGVFQWSGRDQISSPSAAGIQFGGADVAAPAAQTLSVQSVVAGTSNTAGVATVIQGSRGTGTGVGGPVSIATAPAGTTGTAQNATINAFTIDTTQYVINGAGTPTCGTGCASIAAGATNQRMIITSGTAVTAITVNYSKTLTSTPVCTASQESATPVGMGFSAKTTSAFTITALSALTAGVIDVICQ
jgi:hypothetical protein